MSNIIFVDSFTEMIRLQNPTKSFRFIPKDDVDDYEVSETRYYFDKCLCSVFQVGPVLTAMIVETDYSTMIEDIRKMLRKNISKKSILNNPGIKSYIPKISKMTYLALELERDIYKDTPFEKIINLKKEYYEDVIFSTLRKSVDTCCTIFTRFKVPL